MPRGIMILMLTGAIGLLTSSALADKVVNKKKPEAKTEQTSSSSSVVSTSTKVKSKLKAAKGVLHVHVRRSDGKSATRATVIVKSGHHRVVRRANHAGRATISIAGRKSVTVKAHNNHGSHATMHTAVTNGRHSSVTVQLRGGRSVTKSVSTAIVHHHRHHRHQSRSLGTRSSAAAKLSATGS